MIQSFLLPDPGEGLTEAEIVSWRVAEGDRVEINDVLVEIETSKSLVELPSPYAGVVTKLLVEPGSVAEVGSPIVTIDDGVESKEAPDPEQDGEQTATLVGYGPKAGAPSRRRRRPEEERPSIGLAFGSDTPSRRVDDVTIPAPLQAEAQGAPLPSPGVAPVGSGISAGTVLAKPPVRKLARELGVELSTLIGTGPSGTVTRNDVELAASLGQNGGSMSEVAATAVASLGEDRREAIRGVRRITAENMSRSYREHVHVTEWVEVDVTETMNLVEVLKKRREFAQEKVSPTLIFAKAVCLALGRTPVMNASWDEDAQEIVHHGQVNLGIAAATPRGLMVPNIKGANTLDLLGLCQAINSMVKVAKEGRLQPADYSHGTFTITNIGVFGVDGGTPIINGGESAILSMGAITRRPWVVGKGDGERIEPRWVTTVAVSFDHRLIDGEQGSSFLRDIAQLLTQPAIAMLF